MTDNEANPTKPLSAAAERMRRSRQRRKRGERIVPFVIKDTEVKALVMHGLLDSARCNSRYAIGGALGRLLDRIPPAKWPTLDRH
jgi:hypothetical protein